MSDIDRQFEEELVCLSEEDFDSAISSRGGFSREQLGILGVSFPPKKGWKKKLVGSMVCPFDRDAFIALKDEHLGG